MQMLRSSSSNKTGRGCILGFALFWLGFSVLWTVMAWRSGAGMGALFGVPFILIGIVMIIGAFWRTIASVKIAPPSIHVSKERVRIGENFSVTYEQSFRMPSEVLDSKVELIFRESATYHQGTDTRTDTHEEVIDFFESPAKRFERGEKSRESGTFKIPKDAMHTFNQSKNKLQWFVRVDVDVQGWPDMVEEYEIQVLPERMW